MSDSNCPGHDELIGLATGMLPDDSASQLLDHVESCSKCEAALETIKESDDTLLGLLKASAPQDPYDGEIQRAEAFVRAKAMSVQVLGRDGLASGEAVDQGVPLQLGEYELLEELGKGGMGVVYRARQAKLKKIVALKVLTRGRIADEEAVARFEREMEALGAVDHPNIVRAMDAREIEGTPVLVTEYVDGLDLSELVHRLGPLRISDACELIRQAAVGLQYAHQRRLVHRDIKPSNLMLAISGQQSAVNDKTPSPSAIVKILDLGLARFEQREMGDADELTGSGQMMGTPEYMAPEQFSDSHDVDIRADIYGLGATLYKLLCGQAPLTGRKFKTPAQRLMALASEPLPPIQDHRPDVPKELAQVLDRMLAKDPDQRYSTPGDVANALAPFAVEADLGQLGATAEKTAEPPAGIEKSVETDEFRPSALVGTKPSQRFEPLRWEFMSRLNFRGLGCTIYIAVACLLFLAVPATIIYLKTGNGTLVLEVNEPDVTVTIDGKHVRIKSPRDEVSVAVGPHRLEVIKDGFHAHTDSFTIRRRGGEVELAARLIAVGSPTDGEDPRTAKILIQWSRKADMPVARASACAGVYDGMIYVVGGGNSGVPLDVNQVFHPATDKWRILASVPTRRWGGAAGIVSGTLYYVGGVVPAYHHLTVNEAYNIATNTWAEKQSWTRQTEKNAPGGAILDNKMYLIGGASRADLTGQTIKVDAYDPASDTWSTAVPMPTPRADAVTAVVNGRLYVIGGCDHGNSWTINEAFDPENNSWTPRRSMPTPRQSPVAVVLGERIFVIGGRTPPPSLRCLNVVEVYDTTNDSWEEATPIGVPRCASAGGCVGGKLYVIGGSDGTGETNVVEEGVVQSMIVE
ncbi:MAG: protein kinase [Planctomycetes bacterium]|nr:protein kinase [Planctomycetota bacterium]